MELWWKETLKQMVLMKGGQYNCGFSGCGVMLMSEVHHSANVCLCVKEQMS